MNICLRTHVCMNAVNEHSETTPIRNEAKWRDKNNGDKCVHSHLIPRDDVIRALAHAHADYVCSRSEVMRNHEESPQDSDDVIRALAHAHADYVCSRSEVMRNHLFACARAHCMEDLFLSRHFHSHSLADEYLLADTCPYERSE